MTDIEQALRDAFPHFQDDSPITPERIREIGKEYSEMVMGWQPCVNEIDFTDQNGDTRKIVYDSGDHEAGIYAGWTIPEDADWGCVRL